jgi:NAD(P)-dependent dehydrogenase (short-subunit alcohol dehydrogenase family)
MATKSAITGLARGLAYDFAPCGVTVNTIVPGIVATDRTRRLVDAAADTGQPVRGLEIPPIGRLTDPSEIAATVTFLCSDDAGSITGQHLHVNGGVFFG